MGRLTIAERHRNYWTEPVFEGFGSEIRFRITRSLPREACLRNIRPTEHVVSSNLVEAGGQTYRR